MLNSSCWTPITMPAMAPPEIPLLWLLGLGLLLVPAECRV